MKKKNLNKTSLIKLATICVAGLFIISSISIIAATTSKQTQQEKTTTFQILQSDKTGVDFKVKFNEFTEEEIQFADTIYQRIEIDNGGLTAEYGKAELPARSFYVAVPRGAEILLSYDTSGYTTVSNYRIYPSQPPKPETDGFIDPPFTKNETFYATDSFYPSEIVEINKRIIIRGCEIAMITIYPCSYNPVTKEIRKYDDIQINVDFVGGTDEFIPERLRSIYFQPFYDAFLINNNVIERVKFSNPEGNMGTLSTEDRADLLIVVHDDYYDEILPLAAWRHFTGIETKVVTFSEIGSSSSDLLDYMTDAYNDWELPPSFLLIVGEADQVPVNYLYTHPYHYTKTGTDHWYVAVDGSDYYPDMHTGRISVEDEDELTIVVNKILSYSKEPYMDEDWFQNILLAAKEEYGRFFVYTSERIFDFLDPLGYSCDRQYVGTSPPGSTQGVIDAIDDGVIIANHRDHGASQNDGYSYTGWSSPQFDTDHILNDIDNGEKYPVMFSLNCDSGWFDGETDSNSGNYESIGEIGIRVENKGFIAVVASTRVSYSGYNDELCVGFYDAMFQEFDPSYPDGGGTNPYTTELYRISQIVNYGKFWMYDIYVEPGGCAPYPWTPNEEVSRTEFEMFHVHGDPTTDIWLDFPKILSVDHPDKIPTAQSTVEIKVESDDGTPLEGALVCLNQEDGAYAKGITDETGTAYIEIDPIDADINVVVTAHNHLYYVGVASVNEAPETPQADKSGPVRPVCAW